MAPFLIYLNMTEGTRTFESAIFLLHALIFNTFPLFFFVFFFVGRACRFPCLPTFFFRLSSPPFFFRSGFPARTLSLSLFPPFLVNLAQREGGAVFTFERDYFFNRFVTGLSDGFLVSLHESQCCFHHFFPSLYPFFAFFRFSDRASKNTRSTIAVLPLSVPVLLIGMTFFLIHIFYYPFPGLWVSPQLVHLLPPFESLEALFPYPPFQIWFKVVSPSDHLSQTIPIPPPNRFRLRLVYGL